jgi:hypothetical protein
MEAVAAVENVISQSTVWTAEQDVNLMYRKKSSVLCEWLKCQYARGQSYVGDRTGKINLCIWDKNI